MSDQAMQEAVQAVIFLLALVMTVATMIGTALEKLGVCRNRFWGNREARA